MQQKSSKTPHPDLDDLIQETREKIKRHKFKNQNYIFLFIAFTLLLTSIRLITSANNQLQTQKITTPISAPVDPMTGEKYPLPTQKPVSTWKTYINQDYEFSLQYPSNWDIKEEIWPQRDDYYDVLHISLGPEEYEGDIGRFLRIVDDMNIDEVIKSLNYKSYQYNSSTEVISTKDTYFLGFPAKDVTTRYKQLNTITDTKIIHEFNYLIFQKENLTYIFSYLINENEDLTFEIILSTFKFLNDNDQACATDVDCLCRCCQSFSEPSKIDKKQLTAECPLTLRNMSPQSDCAFDFCEKFKKYFTPKCINKSCQWVKNK